MLSITNNQQVNFRRNDNKVTDSDIQKYEKVQDELNEDTFVSENIEQTKPKHRNPVSKFFRNIVLGTALAGGLTAAAPQAEAQNIPQGKVITEQKLVNPKDPSKGTATYYYTQENVLDSMISDYGKLKRIQKFDRKLLNTYPEIKYSYKNIQPGHSYIYNYTVKPFDDNGFYLDPKPELKSLSGKKLADITNEGVAVSGGKRNERGPAYERYVPTPQEDPFFNNPNLQENVTKKGNQIIKSGKFTDPNTNEPYTVAAYYTERPVLDSVIVNKPDGYMKTVRLDRDVDMKSVTHIGDSDSNGKKDDFWLEFDNNGFIKYENYDYTHGYTKDEYIMTKPTQARKK